jgi:hypothetical protein
VTGQEVALTPEDGTYEMIVGASSIAMLASMPFAKGLPGPTTKIRMPTVQMRAVESVSVVGDTLVANPARIPVATWTEGAIEVSHQGVAIASAYAGTTRVIVLMSSGPGPSGPVPEKPAGFNENAADFRQYANQGTFNGPNQKGWQKVAEDIRPANSPVYPGGTSIESKWMNAVGEVVYFHVLVKVDGTLSAHQSIRWYTKVAGLQ